MADLEAVVEAVLESAKYRTIAPEFVRKIGAEELRKHPKLKEAVKATKNRLHQVAGAYLSAPPDYDAWLERLAAANDADERREVCRALMQTHASTRERLPILDEFYRVALAEIAPVRSVLDVACGLESAGDPVHAAGGRRDLLRLRHLHRSGGFLQPGFSAARRERIEAWAADVTQTIPQQPVDLALIIKAIPCLQQIDKSIGARLLEGVQANHVLVSYPAQSLGGANRRGCAPITRRSSTNSSRGRAGRSTASISRPNWHS